MTGRGVGLVPAVDGVGMVPGLVGRVCRHLWAIPVGTLSRPGELWFCPTCRAQWAEPSR